MILSFASAVVSVRLLIDRSPKVERRTRQVSTLGDLAEWGLRNEWGTLEEAGFRGHVQFEHPGHHDHGLRSVAVLEHGKFQCFRTIDKETAAQSALISGDPMPVSVSA